MRAFFLSLALLSVGCSSASTDDTPEATDITDVLLTSRSANCAEYADDYRASATDVQGGETYEAAFSVSPQGTECAFVSNAIPNHDFNATGNFATPISEQYQAYTITSAPEAASAPTALSLQYDNAVFLNGVKLDLLAAGCFGVGNGNIGCNDLDQPYRYDPLGAEGAFGADEHNAHTQPDGTYHYHGNPKALFDQTDPTAPSPVIGFAADGFPIFGTYIAASGGGIRAVNSSYQLKEGTRPGGPGGPYDGTFIDDWEYVEGSGDLDVCNGMMLDGVYGYYVTDTYPHVLGCFTGTPDESFRKAGPGGAQAHRHDADSF